MPLLRRKSAGKSSAPTTGEALSIHINYLENLAERLAGPDREAVLAAAALLAEFGAYLQRTGDLK